MPERIIMRDGNFLSGQLFDVADVGFFVGLAEGDRVPGCTGASRASDAMHIRLRDIRNFVVDDVLQFINIDPARGDVGCDEHTRFLQLEIIERALPGILRFVAVDGFGFDVVFLEVLATTSAPRLVRVKTSALLILLSSKIYSRSSGFFAFSTKYTDC